MVDTQRYNGKTTKNNRSSIRWGFSIILNETTYNKVTTNKGCACMKNKGFTLVELIVVLSIVAVLVLLAAPRFLGYTKDAKITKIVNDVKIIEQAVDEYLIENEEFPGEMESISKSMLDTMGKGGVLYSIKGEIEEVEPGNYKIFKVDEGNNFYANEKGNVYMGHKLLTVLDEPEELTRSGNNDYHEWLRTYDLAPIFNEFDKNATYTLSFEIKSKNTTNGNSMLVYMQTGSGTKHNFVNEWMTVTEEYQEVILTDLKPKLSTDINQITNKPYTTSHLSFYGNYLTGNIPVVRNIKLIVHPNGKKL